MKTILQRLQTLAADNIAAQGALSYVKTTEIVHPEIDLSKQFLPATPKIMLTPGKTAEAWAASQKKQSINEVKAYLLLVYHTRETGIVGDPARAGGNGKGIVDFVEDFISVVRGTRLAVDGAYYLDQPLDINDVDYADPISVQNAHVLVAAVSMQCNYLFTVSLPGNI